MKSFFSSIKLRLDSHILSVEKHEFFFVKIFLNLTSEVFKIRTLTPVYNNTLFLPN